MLPRRKKETIDFIPMNKSMLNVEEQNEREVTNQRTLDDYSIEPYSNAAEKISKEIQSDKEECCRIIEEFSLDPHELLHLLEEWTQQLIVEFRNQKEKFKLILKEKWEKGELDSLKCDEQINRKMIFIQREKLIRWIDEKHLLTSKNDEKEKIFSMKNLKSLVHQSIEELIDQIDSVKIIHQFYSNQSERNQMKIIRSSSSFNETIEHLNRLKQINSKEFHRICIVGLEKAGKSSFINALVGFELLPFRIERCTQIQTILKPIDRNQAELYSTIEFYDENDFNHLIEQIQHDKDEDDESFRRRLIRIREKRDETIPKDSLHRHFFASNNDEKERLRRKLHEFIADEIYLTIVRHVIIYTDRLPGANYILLDVPGCDSPIREHYQSALDAIRNADAFLFLTDGQRPSLTKHQLELLDEIQRGHFDGMKRAFGIITKLDLCQTRNKFEEHREKTRQELKEKGFQDEQIFTVASNVSLLEETKSDEQTLKIIKERILSFDSLIDGFQMCKNALNRFIEYQLPYSRYRLVEQIEKQKVFPYVRDAIALSEEIIQLDNHQISLDDYLRMINTERWNDLFEKERFQPTLARAIRWQKQILAIEKRQTGDRLKKYFSEQFRKYCDKFLKEIHPIRDLMLERFDLNPSQMNAHDIDMRHREDLVLKLFQIVQSSSNDLATFIFENYLQHLEKLLNEISPEIGNLFQGFASIHQCAIELKSVISRSIHRLILCVLHLPRVFRDIRKESTKEFIRLSPCVAFHLLDSQSKLTNQNEKFHLTKILEEILDEYRTNAEGNEYLFLLFRR